MRALDLEMGQEFREIKMFDGVKRTSYFHRHESKPSAKNERHGYDIVPVWAWGLVQGNSNSLGHTEGPREYYIHGATSVEPEWEETTNDQ